MQKRTETNLWLLVALMNDNWKLLSFLIRLSKSSNQFCHICSIKIMLVCLSILSPVFFIFVFIRVKSSKNDHILGFYAPSTHLIEARGNTKWGCVFPMVIWPEFRMWQYRVNDHPYHTPPFSRVFGKYDDTWFQGKL